MGCTDTRDGEIQSDFPELKINNDDRESKASGSVGNASSHVVLNNEHDGIEIRLVAGEEDVKVKVRKAPDDDASVAIADEDRP